MTNSVPQPADLHGSANCIAQMAVLQGILRSYKPGPSSFLHRKNLRHSCSAVLPQALATQSRQPTAQSSAPKLVFGHWRLEASGSSTATSALAHFTRFARL